MTRSGHHGLLIHDGRPTGFKSLIAGRDSYLSLKYLWQISEQEKASNLSQTTAT